MKNWEVAAILIRIAELTAFKEDNRYKSQAYLRAARSVRRLTGDIEEYARRGSLTSIDGVGVAIEKKIEEIISTGKSEALLHLESEFPAEFLDVLAIPGIGLTTGRKLYKHLHVDSLETLEKAVRERKVRKITGLGPKTEMRIKDGLKLLKERPKTYNIGFIAPLVREIEAKLKNLDFVHKLTISGPFRRKAEGVSTVELVVVLSDRQAFVNYLKDQSFIREIRKEGMTIQTTSLWHIPLNFHVVAQDEFWAKVFLTTGSDAHLQDIEKILKEKGLKIDADTFREGEEGFYKALGCSFIPPELREGRGELPAARESRLPSLVSLADIKGDLHTHTNWSDGTENVRKMVEGARGRGYHYIAITDHSPSLKIAGGLTLDELKRQQEDISRLKEESKDIIIFTGMEVDILKDGDLDLPDSIMEELDLVVASVHTGFQQPGEKLTQRICRAMENPHVRILAHPTGRLIGRRDPYPVEVKDFLSSQK